MAKELELLEAEASQRIEQTEADNAVLTDKYALKKEEYEWMQQRYRTLKDDYNQLFQEMKNIKSSEKNKEITMSNMENAYKKMTVSMAEIKDQLELLQSAEDKEDAIREQHEQLVKKKYLGLTVQRAELLK
jgi:chromosome segregation ATPase